MSRDRLDFEQLRGTRLRVTGLHPAVLDVDDTDPLAETDQTIAARPSAPA
jgi:hypothetical protein